MIRVMIRPLDKPTSTPTRSPARMDRIRLTPPSSRKEMTMPLSPRENPTERSMPPEMMIRV